MPRRAMALLVVIVLVVTGCGRAGELAPGQVVSGGDSERGEAAIAQYGCGSCHVIPGIGDARGTVGPPLTDWSDRVYIAGAVPNTPEWLVRWIEDPQAIQPGTAMPDLGVTDAEARDVAAYLYTLR